MGIVVTIASTSFVAWLLDFHSWITPLITFFLGILLTLGVTILFTQNPSLRGRGYKLIKTEAIYEIDENNPKHHTLTTATKIKALHAGVDTFIDTHLWTGQGEEEKIKVISQGHTPLITTVDQSGWSFCYIDLGHELKIGEKETIKSIKEFYDIKDKFEPFFARTVMQPTNCLILQVILTTKSLPVSIIFNEWNAVGPTRDLLGKARAKIITHNSEVVWIFRKIQGKIDIQDGKIYWQIRKPKQGHKYEIRWKY